MTWLIGPAIVMLLIVVVVIRGVQVTKLTHDGVAAEGTVIKKFRTGTARATSCCLRYEYFGPDGRRYEYKIHTSKAFWAAHEVGDTIEIVYAKSKPSISAAREMINRCREAQKLPPL